MKMLERKRLGNIPGARAPPPDSETQQREDVRRVHEAYQFLSKKYIARRKKKDEDEDAASMAAMNAMMGAGGGWGNFNINGDEERFPLSKCKISNVVQLRTGWGAHTLGMGSYYVYIWPQIVFVQDLTPTL